MTATRPHPSRSTARDLPSRPARVRPPDPRERSAARPSRGGALRARGGEGTAVELGVDAQRRERSLQGGTDHGALARATVRW